MYTSYGNYAFSKQFYDWRSYAKNTEKMAFEYQFWNRKIFKQYKIMIEQFWFVCYIQNNFIKRFNIKIKVTQIKNS